MLVRKTRNLNYVGVARLARDASASSSRVLFPSTAACSLARVNDFGFGARFAIVRNKGRRVGWYDS